MSFEQLRLDESLLRAVRKQGYTTPTEIQAKAIPYVIEGRDVLGCAQTGTGKTAAFALPILHRLQARANQTENDSPKKNKKHRPIRTLILSPTRELAAQIGDSFQQYGKHTGLKHTVIFGGVNQNPQCKVLRAGVDILVATPGRLLDLLDQGVMSIKTIDIFVLDEADRMLDMGFIPDIRKVVGMIPKRRQTLLFSATMPKEIQQLANQLLVDPVEVKVKPEQATAEKVEQSIYFVERPKKINLLGDILQNTSTGLTLIFSRTKRGCDNIARKLKRFDIRAETIHSDKSQAARLRALKNFKTGKVGVLIGTDIAARGIDVDGISHVINYDMPGDAETYVHRIGRTGRAGMEGDALSFCTRDELGELRSIERMLGRSIPVIPHDHEPAEPIEALPTKAPASKSKKKRSQGNRRGQSRSKPRGDGSDRSSKRSSNKTSKKSSAKRRRNRSGQQHASAAGGKSASGKRSKKKQHRRGKTGGKTTTKMKGNAAAS